MLSAGRIAFVEQVGGRLSVFDGLRVSEYAATGGAPNATVAGSDGCLYVCQNGGTVGPWRSGQPLTPGIQRAAPDRSVDFLARTVEGLPLGTPNDLAFGPDGRLYFTDPAQPFDPFAPRPVGRLASLGPGEGDARLVIDVGGVYCNGLGFSARGELVWAESYPRTICRLSPGGQRLILSVLPEGHTPDGLAVAEDGRLFITTCESHGIDVLSPEGELLDFLPLDEDANPTNCCFDGSTLWVTDFGMDWQMGDHRSGRLWSVATDATGGVVFPGHL